MFTGLVKLPSGQNLADSAGNPWELWLLVEVIHMEIWVVSDSEWGGHMVSYLNVMSKVSWGYNSCISRHLFFVFNLRNHTSSSSSLSML